LFKRTTPTLFDARRKIVADGQGLTRNISRLLAGRASSRFGLIAVRNLAASNADGPEAEAFDRLDGPTHSNTPRYLTAHLVSASGYA